MDKISCKLYNIVSNFAFTCKKCMYKKIQDSILLLILIALFSIGSTSCKAQTFSVRNNLLYDATLTPNLGFDVRIDSLWSVGVDVGLRPWPRGDETTRKYRHFLVSPEVRRWLRNAGSGHFFGANLLYTHFNVGNIKMPFGLYPSVRHQRKQGDAIAIGPSYGYSWRLASHWSIEAEAGFDIGLSWSDVYECGHCGTKTGTDNGVFLMPRVGINAVYKIGKQIQK